MAYMSSTPENQILPAPDTRTTTQVYLRAGERTPILCPSVEGAFREAAKWTEKRVPVVVTQTETTITTWTILPDEEA